MLTERITIAREEFIQLVVAVQRCSDAQLSAVRRIAAHDDNADYGTLADLGDAVAAIGLAHAILKAVMTPDEPGEPPVEGGHCDA